MLFMIRGINRQNIFEEDDDRICFMKILGAARRFQDIPGGQKPKKKKPLLTNRV